MSPAADTSYPIELNVEFYAGSSRDKSHRSRIGGAKGGSPLRPFGGVAGSSQGGPRPSQCRNTAASGGNGISAANGSGSFPRGIAVARCIGLVSPPHLTAPTASRPGPALTIASLCAEIRPSGHYSCHTSLVSGNSPYISVQRPPSAPRLAHLFSPSSANSFAQCSPGPVSTSSSAGRREMARMPGLRPSE